MIETRDRILDSAEKLFADGGYAATSLRSIMAEAGVNVAAIHYYFRTKESLLEAVLMRRVEPEPGALEALEEYERNRRQCRHRAHSPRLSVPHLPDGGRSRPGRLSPLCAFWDGSRPRAICCPPWSFPLGPVLLRFADALARALPELPPDELFLRSRLAMGATAQVMRDAPRMKAL